MRMVVVMDKSKDSIIYRSNEIIKSILSISNCHLDLINKNDRLEKENTDLQYKNETLINDLNICKDRIKTLKEELSSVVKDANELRKKIESIENSLIRYLVNLKIPIYDDDGSLKWSIAGLMSVLYDQVPKE